MENKDLSNFLVITDKENFTKDNFLQIHFPLKIFKLIEKINIQFIKFKSKENSKNTGKVIDCITLLMHEYIVLPITYYTLLRVQYE